MRDFQAPKKYKNVLTKALICGIIEIQTKKAGCCTAIQQPCIKVKKALLYNRMTGTREVLYHIFSDFARGFPHIGFFLMGFFPCRSTFSALRADFLFSRKVIHFDKFSEKSGQCVFMRQHENVSLGRKEVSPRFCKIVLPFGQTVRIL